MRRAASSSAPPVRPHALATCAEAAFRAALAVARAGVRVNEIGRAVECEVRRRGFSVIKGLSGHGVGRTIHEEPSVPNYYDPFQADMLTEGLVADRADDQRRIEHVVQDDDGWTLRTQDGSLSAHHEHGHRAWSAPRPDSHSVGRVLSATA